MALAPGGVADPPVPAAATIRTCSSPEPVSHRGYADAVSENTITAFDRALAAGSDRVEFDVRFTRDHHPVLMHDPTVERTTSGFGRVSSMSLARFRALRTTDGQHPPTLFQVLAALRGRVAEVLVELKVVPDAADLRFLQATYRLLNAYQWASMTSFSPAALKAVGSIPARKGLLATSAPQTALARQFSFIGVRYDSLTRSRVRAYRKAGVAVYAWTPNTSAAWRRLADYGVSRIITDRTSVYLAWARRACDGRGPAA
ncbi:glycerophosphodiester phosphodiesterase [Nonomuraea sp. NPDC005983]|uniref:glycerophosphodiester phosphodiesterase n=1 Tax=Nonomuraea sp. NPDC005983 TaxID=3155595 RepID=UPI0033A9CB4A